jgi:DNA-directed RNA polymerase subunit L
MDHYKTLNNPWDVLPSKPDLNLKIQSSKDSADELTLFFNGKSVDNSIVNAIRRTMMGDVPVYAFHRSEIKIDRNSSLLNDDEIYNIFETVPIFSIKNPYNLENPELYISNDVLTKLFNTYLPSKYNDLTDLERQKSIPVKSDDKTKHLRIEYVFDIKNESKETINVTSYDGVFTINGKVSNNYKSRPELLLFKLKPQQEFKASMNGILAIAKMSSTWDAVSMCYFNKINENEYKFNFKSIGQLEPRDILHKAIFILMKKLSNLIDFLKTHYLTKDIQSDEEVQIRLYNEDHTLGNLLANVLQKSSKVARAGYSQPHLLEMEILVGFKLSNGIKDHPIKVMIDAIEYLYGVFNLVNQQI